MEDYSITKKILMVFSLVIVGFVCFYLFIQFFSASAYVYEAKGQIITQPKNNSFTVEYQVDGRKYQVVISARGDFSYGESINVYYRDGKPGEIILRNGNSTVFGSCIFMLAITFFLLIISMKSKREIYEYIHGDEESRKINF